MSRSPGWGAGVASAFGLLACYLVFVGTTAGQAADAAGFTGGPLNDLLVGPLGFLRTGLVLALAGAALVVGALALRRDRVRVVAVAALWVAGSVGLGSVLRRVLPRPDLGDFSYAVNTLPSVHAAAAAALVLAVLTMADDQHWTRTRWTHPVSVAVIAGVGYVSVLTYAHRPSDVVSGIALAGLVGALALSVAGRPEPSPARRATFRATVVVSLAAGLLWALLLVVGPGLGGLAPVAGVLGALMAASWVVLLLAPQPKPALPS